MEVFLELRLVGGTALALQIGHRKSIDLDLFGELEADEFAISGALNSFKNTILLNRTSHIKIYAVNGIKLDLVNYPYPWLKPSIQEDDIRLASLEDIAAMKLSAITGRGTKKDFIDIFFLLQYFTLKDILDFYIQKFSDGSPFLVLKSLCYFEDAEGDEMPQMIIETDWPMVRDTIQKETEKLIHLLG